MNENSLPDSIKTDSLTPNGEEKPERPNGKPFNLFQLAWNFLKIGTIGFGGGLAVIALMERECVRRKHCVEVDEFLHGVGLGQFLGAFSVNTALFIGYRMLGVWGGIVAAVSFMTPCVILVILLSWLYFSFHTLPSLQGALLGLGPVLIALILSAAWSIGRKALRSPTAVGLAAYGCWAGLMRVNPIWILVPTGLIGLWLKLETKARLTPNPESSQNAFGLVWPTTWLSTPAQPKIAAGALAGASTYSITSSVVAAVPTSFSALVWAFFKIGFIFFGGGYVLIPLLHQHLVSNLGWLTAREFLDGVAISQLTPGPLAVLATFAGYRVSGALGAVFATIALFLPSTILMLFISHFYQRLRNVGKARDFMSGVASTVVGLIVSAAIILSPDTIHFRHPAGIVLGLASFALLARWNWHPALVLAIGAVVGTMYPGWFVTHFQS